MAGREVVRAVEHHVVLGDERVEIGLAEAAGKLLDAHLGVEPVERTRRLVHLAPPDALRTVEDLPLEVREVDFVGIRDGEPADSGRGEVERRRAAEAARADDERTGGAQPLLSLYADLRKENVPAVAEELLVVQFRGRQLDFVVAPAGLVFSGVGACWPFTGSPFRKASACAS